jgi:hypothetical protein
VLVVAFGVGCRPAGCVAATFGDIVGATGDAHCDRRYVPPGEQAAPFCQEIIDTLATSQFKDDCDDKHAAASGDGRCGREHVIAGCKLLGENDDGSEVWDWYYDVTDIVDAEGPEAGPDGGPTFEDPPHTKEDVAKLCADPERYEDGAELQDP